MRCLTTPAFARRESGIPPRPGVPAHMNGRIVRAALPA